MKKNFKQPSITGKISARLVDNWRRYLNSYRGVIYGPPYNNKKIVSRKLVRSMKLKNKINTELLHHPLFFISLHSMKLPFGTFWYILPHFATFCQWKQNALYILF